MSRGHYTEINDMVGRWNYLDLKQEKVRVYPCEISKTIRCEYSHVPEEVSPKVKGMLKKWRIGGCNRINDNRALKKEN